MEAKKKWNMDTLTDLAMTRLFQLAEYVLSVCPFVECDSVASVVPSVPASPVISKELQKTAPSIRFSNEDRMVEGDLFK